MSEALAAVGLGVGITSLSIQLFEGAVEGKVPTSPNNSLQQLNEELSLCIFDSGDSDARGAGHQ
jgi:hypothetical protein